MTPPEISAAIARTREPAAPTENPLTLVNVHGTARMVPDPAAARFWGPFVSWLGSAGRLECDAGTGAIAVTTAAGRQVASPGDWLIRTMDGVLHLARAT